MSDVAEINAKLKQLEATIKSQKTDWLRDVAQDLTGEAQRRAPKDEGTLRASGHWEVKGEKARIMFDQEYAAIQHERIDFVHTDGEAKYLERPMKEKQAAYINDLAARLRRKIGS